MKIPMPKHEPSSTVVKSRTAQASLRTKRLSEAARLLNAAHKKLPILRSLAWSPKIREKFFREGAAHLPKPTYRPVDVSEPREFLREARRLCRGKGATETWLRSCHDTLETTASMLQAVGTRSFSKRAQQLYGTPRSPFPGTESACALDTAKKMVRVLERAERKFPDPPEPNLTAKDIAREIRRAVSSHFGTSAPEVLVVKGLAARASASVSTIKVRADARFSDLDARQLIQHEAFVHVATSLNGKRQRKLPVLAASHAGTTRTQEGLAVCAELLSGSLDPRRLLRLGHRVVAVDMALEGADFLEVFEYYRDRSTNDTEAYESTVRIFRGGLVTGGAPFPKDMVYLDGLCRVHAFIRAAAQTGRIDMLRLLFAGKMDLDDTPGVSEATELGLCQPPRFVPAWVADPRRMVAYFAITHAISGAASAGLRRHYATQLAGQPTVKRLL